MRRDVRYKRSVSLSLSLSRRKSFSLPKLRTSKYITKQTRIPDQENKPVIILIMTICLHFPFESYQLLDAFPFNPQGQISHPQFPPRISVTHSPKRPLIAYNYSGSILVAPIKGVYTSIHFWNFIANNMNAFKPNFCCYPFGIAFLSVYLLSPNPRSPIFQMKQENLVGFPFWRERFRRSIV